MLAFDDLLQDVPVGVHRGVGEEIWPFLDFTDFCDQTGGVGVDDSFRDECESLDTSS